MPNTENNFLDESKEDTIFKWATNEVALFNASNGEGELDPNSPFTKYIHMCADYALELFKKIVDQNHSGMSVQVTMDILKRLVDGIPLTPLTEKDFEENSHNVFTSYESTETDEQPKLVKTIWCTRCSHVSKKVYSDGTIRYTDSNRVIFVDTANDNSTWTSPKITDLIDEKFPIILPYLPSTSGYRVYGKSLYLDDNGNDISADNPGKFNYTYLSHIITPSNERINLDIGYKC